MLKGQSADVLSGLGIAMGSSTDATKAVGQLVLLDGRLSTLPGVVAVRGGVWGF